MLDGQGLNDYITAQQWYCPDRDGTGTGAVWHLKLQAGLLRGSLAAAEPGVERGGAGSCGQCGAVPEAGVLPWGALAAEPGGSGAEGDQGETPSPTPSQAGQNSW